MKLLEKRQFKRQAVHSRDCVNKTENTPFKISKISEERASHNFYTKVVSTPNRSLAEKLITSYMTGAILQKHFEDIKEKTVKTLHVYSSASSGLILTLPGDLEYIYNSIDQSKYILDLKENWDDEGAKPYQETTWINAVRFLGNYAAWIFGVLKKLIPAPNIYHAPNGSIDIFWKTQEYNLLLNIPEEGEATFHCDNLDGTGHSGNFNYINYKNFSLPHIIP